MCSINATSEGKLRDLENGHDGLFSWTTVDELIMAAEVGGMGLSSLLGEISNAPHPESRGRFDLPLQSSVRRHPGLLRSKVGGR
jgi:hypothetical protein